MGTAKVSGSANGTLNSNEYTVNSTHSKWCITSLEVTVMVNYTAKYTPSMLQQIVTINVTDNGTSKRQEVVVSGTANMVHYAAKSSELVGQQI